MKNKTFSKTAAYATCLLNLTYYTNKLVVTYFVERFDYKKYTLGFFKTKTLTVNCE